MTVGARLAEFIVKASLDDCPSEVRLPVRRATLDTLGVMLAGARTPAYHRFSSRVHFLPGI